MSGECRSDLHDFNGTASGGSSSAQASEIKCRRCGVREVVRLNFSGRTVRTNMQIYPATGSTTISREIIRYFVAVYGSTVSELKSDGYQVIESTPTIHGTSVGI
jgi:hypothetical protein